MQNYRKLTDEMSPELDCEAVLLITYICPRALFPKEILSSEGIQPSAQKSVLGWSLVGREYEDGIGVSHHIIVKEDSPVVQPDNKRTSEFYFVCKSKEGS